MKLASIQLLRGLAALTVMLFHLRALEGEAIAELGMPVAEAPFVGGLFANGYVGVDLFFVISGFIMVFVTRAMPAGPSSSGSFLFGRITRIYPLWWLFLSIFIGYFMLVHGTPHNPERMAQVRTDPTEWVISSYLLQPVRGNPIFALGWTLVHEMYFYVVFAVFLLFARRYLLVLLIAWAGVVITGSLLGHSSTVAFTYPQLIFSPLTLEFILGAFAALLVQSGRRYRPLLVTCVSAIAVISLMVFITEPQQTSMAWRRFFLEWGRMLIFAPALAGLVYGIASLEADGRFREWKPFTWIGDWSYAIYLSHFFVLLVLAKLMARIADIAETRFGVPTGLANLFRVGAPGLGDNIAYLVIGTAATIIFSALVYMFFEKPLIRGFSKLRRKMFKGTSSSAVRPIDPKIW